MRPVIAGTTLSDQAPNFSLRYYTPQYLKLNISPVPAQAARRGIYGFENMWGAKVAGIQAINCSIDWLGCFKYAIANNHAGQ
jgi:hypothetical protein